jgi:hypothetical protein
VIERRLGSRRCQIGSRRIGIAGSIEMFRAQHDVTVSEPERRALVHLPLLCLQERAVDGIPNERMREQVVATFRADEELSDEASATVVWFCDHRLQRTEWKPLTKHRRRLQCLSVLERLSAPSAGPEHLYAYHFCTLFGLISQRAASFSGSLDYFVFLDEPPQSSWRCR